MKRIFKRVQLVFLWLFSLSLLVACRTNDIQEKTADADKDIIEQEVIDKKENDVKTIEENSKKSTDSYTNKERSDEASSTSNSFELEEKIEEQKSYKLDDYIGENYEEIRVELTELGFDVNREEEQSKLIAMGAIVQQRPQPGETATPDEDTIIFSVSTGMPVISLRNLYQYSKDSIQEYVESEGLKLTIEEAASDDVPVGLVISQDPRPGTSLQEGDRITVIYSIGPKN